MTRMPESKAIRRMFVAQVVFALLVVGLMVVAKPAHAADFVVNNTNDSGTGSLRKAITDANTLLTDDRIFFSIFPLADPGCNPTTGVCTIKPASELPAITNKVTMDGYSQFGASENTLAQGSNATLLIELDGTNAGLGANGLAITGDTGSVVRGLVINRFTAGHGITIGGSASGNKVEGNFIGTDAAGSARRGNGGIGVRIFDSPDNSVGGTAPGARNLLSGNNYGVSVEATGATGNTVEGNLIGTDSTGTQDLGNNTDGVLINGGNNTVGGTAPGAPNVIAFSGRSGVTVAGVVNSSRNRILSNSIYATAGSGINLIGGTEDANGRTANDPGDGDAGPNNLQNFPVLVSAIGSGGAISVTGTLNSNANGNFDIQFFSSPATAAPGFAEGKTYLGQKTGLAADAGGNASFSFTAPQTVPAGDVVTATATSATGDTSEFATAIPVAASPDNFADARVVSGNTASVPGTTAGATRETGEPDHYEQDDDPTNPDAFRWIGDHSVWYRWAAPGSGPTTIDTCDASIDSILAVYTGGALNALSRIADNNNRCPSGFGSKVTFNAQAGTSYKIAVGDAGGARENTFTLKLDGQPPDSAAPTVTGVTPPDLKKNVSRKVNVTATFSEAMDGASVEAVDPTTLKPTAFTLKRQGSSTPVAATVGYDATTRKATLDPANKLKRGATYIATVTTGAKDEAGNALDQSKVWKFRVKR